MKKMIMCYQCSKVKNEEDGFFDEFHQEDLKKYIKKNEVVYELCSDCGRKMFVKRMHIAMESCSACGEDDV